jgi:hypothetical protein
VQQSSILGSEQEDQSVDEPQELAEVFVNGPGSVPQPGTQLGVSGIRQKASTKGKQCGLYAVAEAITGGKPFLAA